MKKLLPVIIFFGALIPDVFSQERYIELVRKHSKPKFFIETLIFPSASPDSVMLLVDFKAPYNFLVFHQKEGGDYESSLTFAVEILTNKKAVNRKILQRRVVVKSFKETESKNKFISGAAVLDLKKGEYKFVAEFYDNNTQKLIKSHNEELKIETDKSSNLEISDLLFVSDVINSNQELALKPLAVSEKGHYGKAYEAFVKVVSHNKMPVKELTYELIRIINPDEEKESVVKKGKIPAKSMVAIYPKVFVASDERSSSVSVKKSKQSFAKIVRLDIDSKKLSNAKYKLNITAKSATDSIVKTEEFENAWITMPYPLYDIDLALRLMEHILTPEETTSLMSGSEQDRHAKFKSFWKAKDPTPNTEYNEVMTEFFRRVDYTFFNFYTPREFGWRTDRGKIYILYGKPESMDRKFPFNRPTEETWRYGPPINKTFTFVDKSNNGNYKLVEENRSGQ